MTLHLSKRNVLTSITLLALVAAALTLLAVRAPAQAAPKAGEDNLTLFELADGRVSGGISIRQRDGLIVGVWGINTTFTPANLSIDAQGLTSTYTLEPGADVQFNTTAFDLSAEALTDPCASIDPVTGECIEGTVWDHGINVGAAWAP